MYIFHKFGVGCSLACIIFIPNTRLRVIIHAGKRFVNGRKIDLLNTRRFRELDEYIREFQRKN